jgi:hypothetical protein
MDATLSRTLSGRELFERLCKITLRRVLVPICVWGPFIYFLPKIALFYAICGIYDVSRNRPLKLSTVRRYFLGNGVLLWVLSPINCFIDLISLPYVNKGVYRLEDFPPDYQAEIRRLMQVTNDSDLVRRVEERSKEHKRAMFVWRTYGFNAKSVVDVPAFHEPWKFIETIALSVFNKKVTTSLHFGWLRPTLRVLYNINDMKDKSSYIEVGDKISYWCEQKLFIFDDTLQHMSVNETDQLRYCMFVDILRPSPFPWILRAVVAVEGFISRKLKLIAFSGWTLVER